MICPANCEDLTLTPIPAAGECTGTPFRKRAIYKLGLYLCSDPLPTPLTCESLETLVDSNAVVFTNPLSDVALADPETESIRMNDCDPAEQRIVARTITFNDKYKIVTDTDKFANLTFWGNKNQAKAQLRFILVFCDGTIEVPKDEDGNPASSTFMVYRNYLEQGTGDNSYRIEIVQGSIRFLGDPLALAAPDLDLNAVGCASLAQKIGYSSAAAPTT